MNHFKAVGCAALVSGFTLIGQPAGADDALLKAPLVACASDKTVIGRRQCLREDLENRFGRGDA
jgi:hypothetical protein